MRAPHRERNQSLAPPTRAFPLGGVPATIRAALTKGRALLPAALLALAACAPLRIGDLFERVGGKGGEDALAAKSSAAAETDLAARLREKDAELEQLRAALEELRGTKSSDTRSAPAVASVATKPTPPAGPETWGRTVASLPGDDSGTAPVSVPELPEVGRLKSELAQERQRRESAEYELARIKQETSLPGFGDSKVPESDFFAVKQEVVELRRSLNAEKARREEFARQIEGLNAAAAGKPVRDEHAAELEKQRSELTASMQRSLEESQKRAQRLDAELAALRGAAAPEGAQDAVALRSENESLRARLEEEQKRTAELARKLAVARRITEAIYENDERPLNGPTPPAE